MEFAGIILAGGASRRMQAGAVPIDKALLSLAGQPMIAHVIARLGCARAISANGDPARFAPFGLPVLADRVPDRPGPLAGVLAGMDWAAAQGFRRIVTAAADTPFAPRQLAEALIGAGGPVAIATHAGRDHPTMAAWDVDLRDALRVALAAGMRRPVAFADSVGARRVDFTGDDPFLDDPFFNVNTPDDLARAERRARRLKPRGHSAGRCI